MLQGNLKGLDNNVNEVLKMFWKLEIIIITINYLTYFSKINQCQNIKNIMQLVLILQILIKCQILIKGQIMRIAIIATRIQFIKIVFRRKWNEYQRIQTYFSIN